MADNGLNCPLFVLDSTFISDFINGRLINNKMFNEILRRKAEDLPFQVITNMASLQRGIYLSSDKGSIKNLKFIMELAKIYPSKANYKNSVEVQTELSKFVKLMSEGAL
jgi:hypothetical protein